MIENVRFGVCSPGRVLGSGDKSLNLLIYANDYHNDGFIRERALCERVRFGVGGKDTY